MASINRGLLAPRGISNLRQYDFDVGAYSPVRRPLPVGSHGCEPPVIDAIHRQQLCHSSSMLSQQPRRTRCAEQLRAMSTRILACARVHDRDGHERHLCACTYACVRACGTCTVAVAIGANFFRVARLSPVDNVQRAIIASCTMNLCRRNSAATFHRLVQPEVLCVVVDATYLLGRAAAEVPER